MLEKFSKDRARYVLFLTSFSVILITLGIIQTLLFEAITFFSEVASVRGWFSLDFDFSGILSQTGFAGVLFSIALVAEWFANNKSKSISSIPENLLFPPKAVKNALFVVFGLSFLFLESGLLYLSLIVLMVMWGRIADKSVIGTSSEEADKTVLYVLGFLAFASFSSPSLQITEEHLENSSSKLNGLLLGHAQTEDHCAKTCPLVLTVYF